MKQKHSKFFFLFPILIIALGFIAYANSLNGQFVYDDTILIKDNSLTKNLSTLPNSFTRNFGENVGRSSIAYRPLQQVSNTLNYAICKLDVRGYHLVNIILHILVSLSLFWLINILFNNNFLSLITAILFVVHPIQTEAVSYISGRGDPLALLFMLLSMVIYVKLLNQNRFNAFEFILLLLTYACALFSKEHSIIFPLLLLLYHFVFGKKIKAIEFLSLLSIALTYLVLRASHLNNMAPSLSADTLWDRLPGVFVAIFTYIKLLFLPFSLHMEYGQKLFGWTDLRVVTGVFMTLISFAWAYLKRGNKIIPFSIGWFFLALLPVSNLYKINFFMAEHFLYIPSVGFFLLTAYALNLLYNDPKYKIITLILTTCGILFFLILTIRQNDYWKDPLTFYTKTLELAPDSSNAYLNLGEIYQNEGDSIKAISYYTKAIEFNPHSDKAYNNRGTALYNVNNSTEAILNFNKAIALNPTFVDAYNNRGSVYERMGKYAQAILDFSKVIEFYPKNATVYFNRGVSYFKEDNYAQAILDLNKTIEIDPKYSDAYTNRGIAYNKMGNFDQAILDYNKGIEIDPRNETAYFNRGIAYNNKGDFDQAILDYNKTTELNPSFTQAYFNRGIIYFRKNNYDQAILDFNKTIELNPKSTDAYNNRGIAYNNKGDLAQAILNYSKAIELNPNYPEAYSNRSSAYNNKGNYSDAILDSSKAIELKANYPEAYSNRAIAYYNQREFDKALSDLHKAQELGAKIDPGFLDAIKKASAEPTQ